MVINLDNEAKVQNVQDESIDPLKLSENGG